MKSVYKKILLEIICLLFVLLFVYAAVSKLLVFDEFKIQLGQSPVLTAYAGWVAWTVPFIEIVFSLMLVIPRLRLLGLYASFTLMVMFTAYIVIILNFSDFVPCSCGGILEQLGWTEHLIFNIAFVALAVIGILLMGDQRDYTAPKKMYPHEPEKDLYHAFDLYAGQCGVGYPPVCPFGGQPAPRQ